MASTSELIKQAIAGLQREVPALANLKIVIGLELRGRGDTQLYRVELPGPKVAKGYAEDERLHVAIQRSHFNELADASIGDWHQAYDRGQVRVEGDPRIQKLVGQVIAKREARSQLRKSH